MAIQISGTTVIDNSRNVNAGVVTATSFFGSGSGLTGIGGTSVFAAGSAAAPSISPTGDSNTGIFFPSADTIAFAEGGAEAARFDSSGRLLVGTSTSTLQGSGAAATQQIATFGTVGTLAATNYGSGSAPYGSHIWLGASRGSTAGSATAVANGDRLGEIRFFGGDGTDLDSQAASISCYVDNTPGADDMPGRIVLATTADGGSGPTERMRISANGETTFSATVNAILGLKIGEASGWGGNPAIHTSSNVGYIIIRNGTSGGVGLSGGGTSWSSLSDENYKTDLTPIIDAATKVRSLRTVTGRYIDDDESTSRSFLIAQDVEAVLPEAVSTADSGQKLLSYTDTIPLLTAALKEALEKIETLEAAVTALQQP